MRLLWLLLAFSSLVSASPFHPKFCRKLLASRLSWYAASMDENPLYSHFSSKEKEQIGKYRSELDLLNQQFEELSIYDRHFGDFEDWWVERVSFYARRLSGDAGGLANAELRELLRGRAVQGGKTSIVGLYFNTDGKWNGLSLEFVRRVIAIHQSLLAFQAQFVTELLVISLPPKGFPVLDRSTVNKAANIAILDNYVTDSEFGAMPAEIDLAVLQLGRKEGFAHTFLLDHDSHDTKVKLEGFLGDKNLPDIIKQMIRQQLHFHRRYRLPLLNNHQDLVGLIIDR